jgi:hypothetical protein
VKEQNRRDGEYWDEAHAGQACEFFSFHCGNSLLVLLCSKRFRVDLVVRMFLSKGVFCLNCPCFHNLQSFIVFATIFLQYVELSNVRGLNFARLGP